MAQQTAVEWLIEQVESPNWLNLYAWHKKEVFDYAKQMEKEQTEISDDEILKAAKEYVYEDLDISVGSFELGARWYREQLKKK